MDNPLITEHDEIEEWCDYTPAATEVKNFSGENILRMLWSVCHVSDISLPLQAACCVTCERAIPALTSACGADFQARNQRCGEAESEQCNGGNFGHFACGSKYLGAFLRRVKHSA
jgi:hypothetical protein